MSIDNRLDALSNNRACARKDEVLMTDHMHQLHFASDWS